MFLRTSELRPNNKIEADTRTQVYGHRLDMDLSSNTLWRLHDSGHTGDQEVISDDITFITRDKTFDLIQERFYGTKEEVRLN